MLHHFDTSKLAALRVSLREHRARVWSQAQAPVFRRALAVQTRSDLAVIDLALEHAALRERLIGSKRPRPLQRPGARTISDSLHAADVAAGFDDLAVVLPELDEDTPFDRYVAASPWWEPVDPLVLGKDEWNARTHAKFEELARWAARYGVGVSGAVARCCVPVHGGRGLLRRFWVDRMPSGWESLRLDIDEVGPTVLASTEQQAYYDDAAWAARREDVPERLLDHGPDADMKVGPEIDAPQPVDGPGHDEREWELVPEIGEALDALYAANYETSDLPAQPYQDAVLISGVDENEWRERRTLYAGRGYDASVIEPPAAPQVPVDRSRPEPGKRYPRRFTVDELRRLAYRKPGADYATLRRLSA